MLSIDAVDMDMLITAMEISDTFEAQWWLDPSTGQVEMTSDDAGNSLPGWDLDGHGAVPIPPDDTQRGYRDMRDFIATLDDEQVRAALLHAIEGKRPYRRFKDAVYHYPKVRDDWYTFHQKRMRNHAITWLIAEQLVDPAEAQQALAQA
ncbi:UPF0158 family protein [Arthrobacter sp. USHLN218]|uniref:UPF0158 family protein n=1 Tax=Arthrobacter sp. USHLN218 TaxID=3081232 RepID=UPI003015F62B